jgi:hypothetical protein
VKQGRWTGTWRKTSRAAHLPLNLGEKGNQLKDSSGHYDCAAEDRDAEYHYTYRRKLKLVVTDGVVQELDASQGAYGDDQEEQMCTIDLTNLKQVAAETGVLLQAKDNTYEGEDTRCAVRIVGDKDIVLVGFGDSTEEGNDCRSLGSTMFCSPRAFWNDLDCRTGKMQGSQIISQWEDNPEPSPMMTARFLSPEDLV